MKRQVLLVGILAAVMVIGMATTAMADSSGPIVGTAALPGDPLAASGTINVTATVNPKLTLTINTPEVGQYVDFGAVDPGSAIGPKQVTLAVDSNKAFDLTVGAPTGNFALFGLTHTLASSLANGKGAAVPFTDQFSINVPWTTEGGTILNSTVQYTVTQN